MNSPLPIQAGGLVGVLRRHWPVVLLCVIASFLLLKGLGREHLWADEGDTAVLASSILKHGVPKAWDGVTFTDSDYGDRVNDRMVMVSHPWVQYYVCAASFFLLGETSFAARFPFALAGLFTIVAVYGLVFRMTSERRAAFSAAFLLTIAAQFLIYSRQCRNYSLSMLLTLLLVLAFLRLTSRGGCAWFAAMAVLLFHTHPAAMAPIGVLGLLTLVYRPFFQYRRWFWIAIPIIVALTVPWLFMAREGYQENVTIAGALAKVPRRLAQFFVETSSVVSVFGWAALLAWIGIRNRPSVPVKNKGKNRESAPAASRWFEPGEKNLLVLLAALLAGYAGLMAMTQSRMEMWVLGLRHVAAVIPLGAALTGLLIAKASGGSTKICAAILIILAATNLGRITPWTFMTEGSPHFDHSALVNVHSPEGWKNKLFRTKFVAFLDELWHPNPGAVNRICNFLNENAKPDDILITNYAWEPVYFHTRLPQGLKIMPHYPIYRAAVKYGLPDYVFSVEGCRWVVWRPVWEGYRDYEINSILGELKQKGATITQAATFPETGWENRENVHFRRFPKAGQLYKRPQPDVDVHIFRIDWPQAAQSAAN